MTDENDSASRIDTSDPTASDPTRYDEAEEGAAAEVLDPDRSDATNDIAMRTDEQIGGEDTDDDDADDDDADDVDADDDGAEDPLVIEGDIAGDYLERLLDILDLDGDIDLDVEGSRAIVAVDGGELSHLVGPKGQTLDALQELTRLAVTARTGTRSRLMLDIDGYRAAQRLSLRRIASETVEQVLESGSEKRLRPMNPFERKVVHDVVAASDGVMSESTGEEPNRRVVIRPAS